MSARICSKCQGLGHIPMDCPNRKVITFAKWEVVEEEEKEVASNEEVEENKEES